MEGVEAIHKRYERVDILRGIAITLVIAAHSVLVYPIDISSNWLISWILKCIEILYMPLFFMISGYLFRKKKYSQFICEKVKRLMIPYCLWGGINICLHIVGGDLVNHKYTLKPALVSFFLYGGEYWFLYVLFEIFIFSPIIYYMCQTKKRFIILEIILLIMSFCIDSNFLCAAKMFYYMFFFSFGHFIHVYDKKEISKGNQKTGLLLSIGLYGIAVWIGKENGDTGIVLGIIGAISGCFLAYYIATRINSHKIIGKYLKKAGEYSLGFYILNGYCLVIARVILINIFRINNPYILYVTIFLSNCLAELLICEIISRIKPIAYVTGIPYKSRGKNKC